MDEEVEEQFADPLTLIQNALSQIGGEGSLCSSFAVVAEWLEDDGSTSLSVLHSPMPPWHMYGLLTYARDECTSLVELGLLDGDDDF